MLPNDVDAPVSASAALRGTHTYSIYVAFAVMINYIIGTGVFGLPSAFITAGSSLSIACLVAFGALAWICLAYTLESMARAQGCLNRRQLSLLENRKHTPNGDVYRHSAETAPLLPHATCAPHVFNINSTTSNPLEINQLGQAKIDFTLMSQIFGGWQLVTLTQICLALYSYGVLWAYVAVFASSVDSLFFEYVLGQECNIYLSPSVSCQLGYYVAVVAFGMFVIVVSFMDLAEQATLQLFLTGYRVVAFAVMIVTCLYAMLHPNVFDPNASTHSPYISPASEHTHWNGFGTIFTFSAVALNVHYNMPDVVQPVRDSHKSLLLRLSAIGMMGALLFYIFIGWVCALLFGPQTLPLVTLNWQHYTGIDGGWGALPPGTSPPVWATLIKLSIMLFPVLNMLSVYPLIVVSLGDNMLTSLPAHFASVYDLTYLKNVFRMVACIPPLILGMIAGKLDIIFNATGLCAFFLELIIPCLFQLLSISVCRQLYGDGSERTPYSTIFSGSTTAWLILCVSSASFAFSLYQLVLQPV